MAYFMQAPFVSVRLRCSDEAASRIQVGPREHKGDESRGKGRQPPLFLLGPASPLAAPARQQLGIFGYAPSIANFLILTVVPFNLIYNQWRLGTHHQGEIQENHFRAS